MVTGSNFLTWQAARGKELPKLGNAFWIEAERSDAPSQEPEIQDPRHDFANEGVCQREFLRRLISPGRYRSTFFDVLANGKNAPSVGRKRRLERYRAGD